MSELCDEHQRFGGKYYSVQPDDVLMIDRVHYGSFFKELHGIALHSVTAQTLNRYLNSVVSIRPHSLLNNSEFSHSKLFIDTNRIERNDVLIVGNFVR